YLDRFSNARADQRRLTPTGTHIQIQKAGDSRRSWPARSSWRSCPARSPASSGCGRILDPLTPAASWMNGALIRIWKSARTEGRKSGRRTRRQSESLRPANSAPRNVRDQDVFVRGACAVAVYPSPSRTGTSGIDGLLCGIIELERGRNKDEVFDIQQRQ